MKILIVDDEMITIKMLQKIINWKELGLEVMAYADDGKKAYEKVLEEKPDIILSDIRMANMSGLELVKKVFSLHKDIKIILMSGYANFEYVKKAMELGCSNYILKPIDELELENSIKKIIEEIKGEKHKNKILDDSAKQLRRFELYKYMKSGLNYNKLIKYLTEFSISFKDYSVILLKQENKSISDYTRVNSIDNYQQNYIEKMLAEIIGQKYEKDFIHFSYLEEEYMIIVDDVSIEKIIEISLDIVKKFEKELDIDTVVCFSKIEDDVKCLPKLYKDLKKLSNYAFYLEEKVLGYGYNCNLGEIDDFKYTRLYNNIEQALKSKNILSIKESINYAFDLTNEINPENLEKIYDFCYRVLILFEELTLEKTTYESLKKYNSLKDLKEHMLNILSPYGKNIEKVYSPAIEKCLKILAKEYNKNITLDDITREVAVSKNYFCWLFKKETGKSIWNYLTKIRLNEAKKLLLETDMKTYEIAFKVGYDNPSYFSKIFKKLEKLTPNEYREKNNIVI